LTAKAFIGTGGATANREFVDAIGIEDTNGVMDSAFASTGSNEAYAKGMSVVYKLYNDEYGTDPTSVYPLVGYVGASVLWEVLENAGEMDPAKIREAALAIDKPEGSTATGWGVKFAGPDEPNAGQNLRAHNVLDQWQDGELKVLYPDAARYPDVEPIIPLPSWAE
jgi:branched-chain amino acid transport system substrate-binding protein